ncbi:hypothetical protein AgCh_038419 [Apium graveolens]
MGKKKPRTLISKKAVTEEGGEKNEEKQLEVKQLTPEKQTDVKQLTPEKQLDAAQPTDDPGEDVKKADSDVPQETVTSIESRKRKTGATRGVCAMHKVVTKKAQRQKFKIRYNRIGIPIGDTRHTLQSYIDMLARTMVPIDLENWLTMDEELKAKIWSDVQDTFKVAPESEGLVLKSAGTKWRQFKYELTRKFVKPYIGKKKKLSKPLQNMRILARTVGEDLWIVEFNISCVQEISKVQSERIKAGRLAPEELPDRAIFWKKARTPPDGVIDEELAKTFEKIDELLEKKRKGEFVPSGSEDVLSIALETPEHSGRVRGVGSFVNPSTYFNLPKGKDKKSRVRKTEFKQTKNDFEKRNEDLMLQIAELKNAMKEMASAAKLHSPMLFDKASYRLEEKEGVAKMKQNCGLTAVRELMVENNNGNGDDYVDINHFDPLPGKKDPRKCELAVDVIENKVPFGMVFSEDGMSTLVHGVPLEPGYARVQVDGTIKKDALVSVPIAGEIETVRQAVGSLVAWPKNLIIFSPPTAKKKKEVKPRKTKIVNAYQKLSAEMKSVKPTDNVP